MKRRNILIALLLACAALLQVAGPAQAEIAFQSSFGESGEGAGQFSRPAGVAVNHTTGDVYVVDRGNNRIQQFTKDGGFIRAWGFDVVASGEDDKPFVNEVDEVKIRASSGSFRLSVEGESTGLLKFDASASEVEAALNGLAPINSGGGHVSVSGGPGDSSGSTPYVVTFDAGPVSQKDMSIQLDSSALALPAGTQLSCTLGGFLVAAISTSQQWLADGVPIPGATSSTFTPGPDQAGKAIQCLASATYAGDVSVLRTSRTYLIASGTTVEAPPLGPEYFYAPESEPTDLNVGESNGAKLTCNAGTWSRNPETYVYRWYRNGTEIASTPPTTQTSNVYTLTAEDTENKASFQCSVTATNAGGASTVVSDFKNSKPAPEVFYSENIPTATLSAPPSSLSRTITKTNGGPVFEICEANPPSTDVCKAGAPGPSFGQFDGARSIAVDNSPGGDGGVFVHEEENFRIQKFSSAGQRVLEFGKAVDETSEADICTASSGHACGRGMSAVDESPVAIGYGGLPWFGDQQKMEHDLGNQLAVDMSGHVYLAEPRRPRDELESPTKSQFGCPPGACHPRIQKFSTDGEFISMARLPVNEGRSATFPLALGVDSSETVYVTIGGGLGQGIERIHAGEFGPTGGSVIIIGNLFLPSGEPRQVAIDPRNDRPLVSDINEKEQFGATEQTSVCGGPRTAGRAVIEFDVRMNRIDCSVPLGLGNLPEITGMAVNGESTFYAATGYSNLVKIFKLPLPESPDVGAESAKKITTQTAELHAQIHPGFEETTYSVEYGTEDCAVSTCAKVQGPEAIGGLKYTDSVVKIAGLLPDRIYHYRFVAENPVGSDAGEDMTFSTYRALDLRNDPCPNALARKQTAAAGVLDCRAYELTSAEWTGGYDVISNLVPGQNPFEAFPDAGGRVLYGVKDGGIPGTGYPTNRGIDPYVAERGENGWSTRYMGIPSNNPYAKAPFSSTLTGASADLSTFAFGGSEICHPCFADGSSGVPVRLPNGDLVQGMTGSNPEPAADEAGHVAAPLSDDGKYLVFGSTSALEPAATDGQQTLYERALDSPVAEVISTLPDGSTMSGELGELALSSDGSRAVVAQKVGTDAAGNPLWHPYLHIRGSANSIDLTDGATSGVYFSGMTADGSVIYLSTVDQLPVDQSFQDEDESLDIYRAKVDGAGDLSLELVTVKSDGGVSNFDGCEGPGAPDAWNAIEGGGKCNAVALAGGAGVAAGDGSFFFISPEQLEPGKGIENQPNLYVVEPGGSPAPRFVALMDNSLEKPGQPPAQHPLLKQKFGEAQFLFPGELTFDQSNDDLYAVEVGFGEGNVYRYHSDGTPHNFTAGPAAGGNVLSGFSTNLGSWTQLAVDNSPASTGTPLENALYVPDFGGVHIFAPSGEPIGVLNGSGTAKGIFSRACGVAVNQSTGVVYVADHGSSFPEGPSYIWEYTPNSPSGTVDDSDYTVRGIQTKGMPTCSIAADNLGNVYAAQSKEFQAGVGPAFRWSAGSFTAASPPPVVEGTEFGKEVKAGALAIDPETNEIYVDAGREIRVFDTSGNETSHFGLGSLECTPTFSYNSRGVAINTATKHVYASCMDEFYPGFKGGIREWGILYPPYTPIDNPAVLHGVDQPEVHTWGDFQVTPNARYAAFATPVPVNSAYDNGGFYEVYRRDGETGDLLCVSCNPTGGQASSNSVLPPSGLGLLEDGRVFFNSGESLTLEDTNEKLDAYEYSPERNVVGGCHSAAGCQQLISTGTSSYPSGLLGVTSDGKDAFFFTRDTLVPNDRNGEAMKIYDAREGGGFFVIPPPPGCAASDECHGPGTRAQAAPQIGSYKGTGGQANQTSNKKCKKGFKRKHGKCVKKHRKHRKHNRTRHGHGGKR
jgi:hypothetical protein